MLVAAQSPAAENATGAAAAKHPIPVAVLIDNSTALQDFALPWVMLQAADAAGSDGFWLYTVAVDKEPKTIGGDGVHPGLVATANFSIADAPMPKILVVGAQAGRTPEKLEWIRRVHAQADVTFAICTGSYVLAAAGLLDGRRATTHHRFYDSFAKYFPKVEVVRDVPYVDLGDVATARGIAGSTAFALKLVERYYGAAAAIAAREYMEVA